MVFEDLLRPLCLYLFQLRGRSSGGSRVGKDCLWNDELQRERGRGRERPEEAQTEAGKAIISAGRASEI